METSKYKLSRRAVLTILIGGAGGAALVGGITGVIPLSAESAPNRGDVTLYKNPQCDCCEGYASYLHHNGFQVKVVPTNDLTVMGQKYGIADNEQPCHISLIGGFVVGLERDRDTLPSPLIGKAVLLFSLPPVEGRSLGLSTGDLGGDVALVNVFASWCVACREEHPVLMRLAARGTIPVHGLNYKDKLGDAAHWLDAMGDPYTRTGADLDGRVAIDWGVYGVPETFVVDRGRIAFKQVGPI